MKRIVAAIVILAVGLAIAWFATGGLDRLAARRIEGALVAQGILQPMAQCMANRMAKRLDLNHLQKLEGIAEGAGEHAEAALPAMLEEVRRTGDPEVIEVTASSAAICAFPAQWSGDR